MKTDLSPHDLVFQDRLFILKDGQPVPCPDLIAWADWMFHERNSIISVTKIRHIKVSTVFLGMKHWGNALFETMVFGGDYDHYQSRYETIEDARKGHAYVVALIQE